MRTITEIPKYTYEDYIQWEGRWELIDGYPYSMVPMPSIQHQKISGKIYQQLDNLLADCPECTPLIPVDWKINEETIVQPDNCVICYEASGNFLTKPPNVVFEILSPSTAKKDKTVKFEIYQEQGVKYYIIIDPQAKSTEVYELLNNKYRNISANANPAITFDLGECKINFDFSKIWLK